MNDTTQQNDGGYTGTGSVATARDAKLASVRAKVESALRNADTTHLRGAIEEIDELMAPRDPNGQPASTDAPPAGDPAPEPPIV